MSAKFSAAAELLLLVVRRGGDGQRGRSGLPADRR
jgi:hypothetical protein